MIDGKQVFKGPDTIEQYVLPGEHHVVATKPGFLPASRKIGLAAGPPPPSRSGLSSIPGRDVARIAVELSRGRGAPGPAR